MAAMLRAPAECFESLNIWRIKALVLTASRLIGLGFIP